MNEPHAEAGAARTMSPVEMQVAFEKLTKRVLQLEDERAREKQRAEKRRAAWQGALGWLKQLAEN